MCLGNSQCVAWSFGIPLCGGGTDPLCWLKGTLENTEEDYCRISGKFYLYLFLANSTSICAYFLFSMYFPGSRLQPVPVKYTVYDGTNVVATGSGFSARRPQSSI